MQKKINTIIGVLFVSFTLLTAGNAYADGPGGNYVQAAYSNWDEDGYNLAGSYLVVPEIRLFVSYTDTQIEHFRIGGGYVFPLLNELEGEVGVSYHNFDVGRSDDDGVGIHGSLRYSPLPELTLSGKLEYVFLDDFDDEWIVGLDANYRLMNELSGFVSYDFYDEASDDLFSVGLRLHF